MGEYEIRPGGIGVDRHCLGAFSHTLLSPDRSHKETLSI